MLRWFSGALAVLSLALMAVAQPVDAADDRIKKIKDAGKLRICHAEALPMNFKNPKTNLWEGYNVDAGEDLAKEMGVPLEHVDATWATVIPSLLADKCDIGLVGLFRTAARAQVILFANAWGFDTQSMAVHKDSGLKTYADLDQKGKTVAVMSGTADEAYAKVFLKNAEVKPFVTDKGATIYLEVANKRADAAFTDTTNNRLFLKENPAMNLRELGDKPVNPQGYSYAIAPGEYHFLNFVNVWMERTETSGKKQVWMDKWFKSE
ncbi:MAG: substrate-binding periplasmic protein [Alphaproteobacteria bacterium]